MASQKTNAECRLENVPGTAMENDIYYNRTNYELAYTLEYIRSEDTENPEVVIVIMAGTREDFYDELKRYWT